jgi:glyoxylase-like metal-dependent hydrolase (beta-lactamase superfamily II)
MTAYIRTTLFALAVLVVAMEGTANADRILPAPEQVSEHVYAWIGPLEGPNKQNQGYRMNLAFVVGGGAVAVLDTGYTTAMAEEMVAHIRKITELPIRYAVSTNSQPHRHFGNDVFRATGATILASPEEAARMKDMGGMLAQVVEQTLGLEEGKVRVPQAPDTLVEAPHSLDLGNGVTVRLIPAGGSHTPNSLIAEVATDKVVYAGDVLYAGRLLAILDVSDTGHWIEAYNALRKFEGYTFIPGHGRPAPLLSFEFPTYSYLTKIWAYMTKAVADGVDLGQATKTFDQSAYEKLKNFEELAGRNASRAYLQAELASF